MSEFCPRCGDFFEPEDFDADEGFCVPCARGPDARKCSVCGRWHTSRTHGRCSTCRERKRKKNDNSIEVRCPRCKAPFRVLGHNGRQVFCSGCVKWQYHYRKLRKEGMNAERALRTVLAMPDSWNPKTCLYCGDPIHGGKFCAECAAVRVVVSSRVRRFGETFEQALAHVRVTHRGQAWRRVQRRKPRYARARSWSRPIVP